MVTLTSAKQSKNKQAKKIFTMAGGGTCKNNCIEKSKNCSIKIPKHLFWLSIDEPCHSSHYI